MTHARYLYSALTLSLIIMLTLPRAGSGVVRMDLTRSVSWPDVVQGD